jgi:hypothetical protein
MKKLLKSLMFGVIFFFFIAILIGVSALFYTMMKGFPINSSVCLMIINHAIKGGLVGGVALAIIFFIGGSRPMTPGGR